MTSKSRTTGLDAIPPILKGRKAEALLAYAMLVNERDCCRFIERHSRWIILSGSLF